MLGTLLGAVPITWFGRLMDRFGIRPITLGVLLAFAAACGTVSLAGNWYTLVIAFTLLRMLGPGALSLMSANVLPFWFHRRLGTVEGFRQTAMAVAMAIIPGLNLWLVLEFGWRGAYIILAGGLVLVWPLFWLFFRNHPEELGHAIDGDWEPPTSPNGLAKSRRTREGFALRQVLRTATFWSALTNGSLYSLIHTGVFFCLVPILAEQGLEAKYSAWMLMVFAISLAINQMLGGWLADRLPPAWQMLGGQVLFSLGLALLYWGGGVRETLLAGGIMGAAQGYFFAASNPLWARFYGLKHLGAIRGFLMSFHVALSSIGPLLVGWCHDLFGDFQAILLTFACLPCLFSLTLFMIREPGPKPS
jgi:MFS family permease